MCIRDSAESPDINIQITGAPPGRVRLIGIFQERQYLADSTSIGPNGTIVFKNKMNNGDPYKAGLYFLALEQGGSFQMLLDKDQTFSMATHINDLTGAMQVKGSVDNQVLFQSAKKEGDLQTQINAFSQQLKSLTKGTPAYDNIKKQRDAVIAERKAGLEKLFQQYPNTCLLYTSPSPRDLSTSRMPSSA